MGTMMNSIRRPICVGFLLLALGACGGSDDEPRVSASPETTETDSTVTEPIDAAVATIASVDDPDADWSSSVIESYDAYITTDLDRTLGFIEAAADEPDKEIELFAQYLRDEADALAAAVAGFPPDGPTSPQLSAAVSTWTSSIDDRLRRLRGLADELTSSADTTRYEEIRQALGETDSALQACYDVQAILEERTLGGLRCLPGPE